jgi:ribosomal protein S18 acetylase RimI-like enzyme
MSIIRSYEKTYESDLIALLKAEPDWSTFTAPSRIGDFCNALLNSETYVCVVQGRICGYIRALVDGFGIYVSELYVAPGHRGHGYGTALLQWVKQRHLGQDVYVLSDEDPYYDRLGFKRVGSLFKL